MTLRSAAIVTLLVAAASPATRKTASAPAPPKAATAKAAPAGERQWVQRWKQGLSLRDMAAQLIVMPFYGESPGVRTKAYQQFVHQVRDLHIGGYIVNNRVVYGSVRTAEPHAMAAFLNRMQKLSRIPLIGCGDFERGPSLRITGATKFPANMAYGAAGDLEASRYEGAATAREARAIGVQWIFAPVADVNNNPENPIINTRSYGENPEAAAAHVRAFIEGARSDPANRVILTAKHFPGHGDTSTDSHLGLATITADRARMDAVELVPFRAAIQAGVDSIMTAHISVPAIDPEPIPATVSRNILTGLLRKDLKFDGIIVTDAMDMQGLSKQFPPGEAALRSLEAGADVLLMPTHPDEVIRAVVAAVQSGRIPRARLEQSVNKVLAAKARVGLQRGRYVDIEKISDAIDTPESDDAAQAVANRAVTLVKNERNLVPLRQNEQACMLILSENRYSQQGRRMIDELKSLAPKMKTTLLDPLLAQADFDEAAQNAASCAQVVVAAFGSVRDSRGTTALAGPYQPFVEKLAAAPAPVILISLGNPYLLRTFPNVAAYLATFSAVTTSETAAVRALVGEIPITGKLPVSIPGIAKVGDGIASDSR